MLIALADATSIGAAPLVLGVPLWLSLTLLTFRTAFGPAARRDVARAGLVTSVTDGTGDADIVLVVVIAVQQVQGPEPS